MNVGRKGFLLNHWHITWSMLFTLPVSLFYVMADQCVSIFKASKCVCLSFQVSGIGKVSEKMLNALGISSCSHLGQQMALLSLLFSETAWHHLMQVSLGLGSTYIPRYTSLWLEKPNTTDGIKQSSLKRGDNTHSFFFNTDMKKGKAWAQRGMVLMRRKQTLKC